MQLVVETHLAHILLHQVQILHGLNEVIEGGSVVLSFDLKNQNVLVDGDLNEEVENLSLASFIFSSFSYRFGDGTGSQRPILPHYDDPVDYAGVNLVETS
ncbi:hypothetical protein J5N97_009013 [Dioscorea zingiberensis]|uniref:Uncharacterized protein n=1 Tax=Dioscorea zingiberensis TaxID=325984 RepID=A0A9D5CWS9_9LILI|nr:hypothetical protein J5N97_009013 [Dioscorea zingiberensis]